MHRSILKTVIAALILIIKLSFLDAQGYLNLDFETSHEQTNTPAEWIIGGNEYKISLDTAVKFKGERSLKIESLNPGLNDFGGSSLKIPRDLSENRHVKFKGKIKTESLQEGYAGLWMRIDGIYGELNIDDMSDRGYDGTNNWTDAEISLSIDTSAMEIHLGAFVSGSGTAWFDDFEIFIDDVKHKDIKLLEPTEEEMSWLKGHIHPLSTYDPTFENSMDLEHLDQLIGDSEVIALGESTHGSSEIFKMKHRIIKHLTQKNNHNIFSIEANMPESYKVNEYIKEAKTHEVYKINEYTINKKISASDLIKDIGFWTWNTEEMLGLVEWMKEQNRGKNKIQYTGFDMQIYYGGIEELRSSFQDNLEIYNLLLKIEIVLNEVTEKRQISGTSTVSDENRFTFFECLDSIKWHINNNVVLQAEQEWLIQNCRILEQLLLNNSRISRDEFMAENLLWIKSQNPDSKIIIWAHNEHIKKTEHRMGEFLSDSLNDNYISIGFAFYSGQYTAIGDGGLGCYPAEEAYLGTYEYIFNKMSEPIFMLDLRQIKKEKSEFSNRLMTNLKFRKIGATKQAYEFDHANLCADYDIIIFINESTCSTILD